MERNIKSNSYFWKPTLLLIFTFCLSGCSEDSVTDILETIEDTIDDAVVDNQGQSVEADINGDGELNILI